MGNKITFPPNSGNTLTIESFMPRVLLSIDKAGIRVYKGINKMAEYIVKRDGRFKICYQLATTHHRSIVRTERAKAVQRYDRRVSSLRVKSLDEIFGKKHCTLFNMNDIKDEVHKSMKDIKD